MQRSTDAGDEAATPNGRDDRGDLRDLLDDLKRHGALAGHDCRVVERVNQRCSRHRCLGSGGRERVFPARSGLHDLGAPGPDRHELGGIRPRQSEDGRADSAHLRGIGDAKAMIAGRGCYDPLRPRRQRVDGEKCAPHLEGPRGLSEFELEPDFAARQIRQGRRKDA